MGTENVEPPVQQRDGMRAPASPRWFVLAAGVVIFLVGFYLRLDALTSSLWLDEFGTFWVVQGDLWNAFQRSWQFQGQSPLYYVFAWAAIHLFGESEFALRLPSLIFGILTALVMYWCGRVLAGPRAGWWAAALTWLSVSSISMSASARPYSLVLFSVAAAIAGFQSAVRSGRPEARAVWIVGGAMVAWAHYVQYPLVVGLGLAYALFPALRVRYSVSKFLADALLQATIVSLCAPQVFALLARRDALSWIDGWNYLVFVGPLLPLLPAIAIGLLEEPLRRSKDPVSHALRRSLWCCLLVHVGTLESAALLGVNLLSARYFLCLVIPGVALAADALTRVRSGEAVAALVAVTIITTSGLVSTKAASGSFSGAGSDDWRSAVATLSERVSGDQAPLVFYRSGFVEEDLLPVGAPPAATLAPLRSPGRRPFSTPVRSLTYRWDRPSRQLYFDEVVVPAVANSPHFHVLSSRYGPEAVSYPELFVAWVEETWPGRFETRRTSFGGVELLEFSLTR